MPEVHVTLVGAIIAFGFLAAVVSILHWMLNPPPAVKMTLADTHEKWSGTGAILVPATGSELSARILELAADIAQKEQRQILLLFVVEIPMALPPDADLPGMKAYGEDVLIHLQGQAQKLGVPVEARLLKARNAGSAIVNAARESHARMIVVPIRPQPRPEVVFDRMVERIFQNAPCDVLIYRPGLATSQLGSATRQEAMP